MNNILVTGGAGFIGANFIRYALTHFPSLHIVNLDRLTYAGSTENLKGLPAAQNHIFVQGDICDRALVNQLLQTWQIDTIVHFAAESHVDRSILGPEQFIQTNIIGTFTLLEAARHFWVTQQALPLGAVRFHHISTDEVFGSLTPQDPPFCETTAYTPRSPYSASKASSDHLVMAYHHTYGLPVSITNCTNNYGPYQFPEKLVPLMILNAIEGKPLPVYGDGRQIRDWLYVEDHCEAILTVIQKGRPGQSYNVGGSNQPANLYIIERICAILDELLPDSPHRPHQNLIRYVADRPGHDRRYAMNIEKIHHELGWQPRHALEDGLKNTILWYLNHPEWIAAIRQKQEYQSWLQQNYANRGASK